MKDYLKKYPPCSFWGKLCLIVFCITISVQATSAVAAVIPTFPSEPIVHRSATLLWAGKQFYSDELGGGGLEWVGESCDDCSANLQTGAWLENYVPRVVILGDVRRVPVASKYQHSVAQTGAIITYWV